MVKVKECFLEVIVGVDVYDVIIFFVGFGFFLGNLLMESGDLDGV